MKARNFFVDQTIADAGMPPPTIPAYLTHSYSQCYEDVIVESMLRAYVKTHGTPQGIVFVEIGANHPVSTSSSYLLRKKYNIQTYLIEANPKLIPALEKFRPGDRVIQAAVVDHDLPTVEFYVSTNNETSSLDGRFVSVRTPGVEEKITVPTIRANDLLEQAGKTADLILLSVDVEGYDLNILKDINWTAHRPLLVIVEPSEDYQPGSTRSIIDFMQSKGYELSGETDVNLIFKDPR
jgi:FkbM family methyltransferase